jgi:membrane protein
MRRAFAAFKAAGLRFSSDGCAMLAQAIAFNAVFSIFPLIVLIIAALAFVYGDASGQSRTIALIGTLAPAVQTILIENVQHVVEFRGPSGIIALGALVWSGKNLFQTLAYALNRALDIPSGRPFLHDILVAIVMLPILAVLFLLATSVPLVVSFAVSSGGFQHAEATAQVAAYGASFALVFVVATVLYDALPNRRLGLAFGVPGAIFVTIAWEVSQIAFAFYSTHVDYRHVYGALAAIAVLLVWFYYMASIFLYGAELCAQWARRSA